jgi:hypothetical protein
MAPEGMVAHEAHSTKGDSEHHRSLLALHSGSHYSRTQRSLVRVVIVDFSGRNGVLEGC